MYLFLLLVPAEFFSRSEFAPFLLLVPAEFFQDQSLPHRPPTAMPDPIEAGFFLFSTKTAKDLLEVLNTSLRHW